MSILSSYQSMTKVLGQVNGKTQTIAYNDAAIQYLGRWIDTGSGKWTGWAAPMIVFTVTGTNWIQVNGLSLDPSITAITAFVTNADNSTAAGSVFYATPPQFASALVQSKSTMIMLPDTGSHTIIIRTTGYNADIFNEVSKNTVQSFTIPATASITSWTQGAKVIQCVGDSWMGAGNDWPRLMSTADYKLFPIATGGLKCSDMDTQYTSNYSGNPAVTDTNADAVVVSFGVNDYNAGVTTAAFETSMFSLYDKIRVLQPTAKIFLIRCVRNLATGDNFGQYGPNMAAVVAARTNCFYVDTTSLDATVTWASDTFHLDGPGKQLLANFVKAALVAQGV